MAQQFLDKLSVILYFDGCCGALRGVRYLDSACALVNLVAFQLS